MTNRPIRLDDRDIKILAILQKEGRISKAALAERVALSPAPLWERLRRLETAGLVEGYRAKISDRAFGPVTVLYVMIEIESHRKPDFVAFEAAVGAIPEITECWSISGGFDYLCKFVTRDLESYQRIVDALISDESAGVRRYFTYPVMHAVKRSEPDIALYAEGEA